MYLIYKGKEYFGVCYENFLTALYVCKIFQKTLKQNFYIRWSAHATLLLAADE